MHKIPTPVTYTTVEEEEILVERRGYAVPTIIGEAEGEIGFLDAVWSEEESAGQTAPPEEQPEDMSA